MKKILLLILLFSLNQLNAQILLKKQPTLSQEKINSAAKQKQVTVAPNDLKNSSPKSVLPVLKKIDEVKKMGKQSPNQVSWAQSHDSIFVGAVPHDTLLITGNWHHYGPIFVLNDGVLIFKNATVVDTGDIYIFQQGQLLADSSSLTFPQQYFYQRSLIVVQNAVVNIQHCSFNYSGMSHNLVIGGNASVTMNHIHQHDWTTCGLFGKPTLHINGCNQAGEYILSDSSTTVFKNTDTLILWHQFPDTAVVNFAFPNGNAVYNYHFNKTISGIQGVEYSVSADSCHDVMWAMMPTNGSNITISNSTVRAIGVWFQRHDTVHVSNLYNNSSYTNFVAPLADRNLHLINTNVQTWSLYVFDKSHINVDSVTVGEVGTESKGSVTSTTPFLLDGSGGYYWATDTSSVFAFGSTVYSYVRSEKNGVFVLAYGWVPFYAPEAIGNSVMICIQSTTAGDPVAYDAATAWLDKIDGPDTSYTNAQVPVMGSAWIDWGPSGTGWLNFANYSMYYQLQGSSTWTRIVKDSLIEIHHNKLINWNTAGLAAGNYNLKLTVKDNINDSVEAIRPITLLFGVTDIKQTTTNNVEVFIYPNPNNGSFIIETNNNTKQTIQVYDVNGKLVLTQTLSGKTNIDASSLNEGVYNVSIISNEGVENKRLVIVH
jgi:hypothetical protein